MPAFLPGARLTLSLFMLLLSFIILAVGAFSIQHSLCSSCFHWPAQPVV